LRQIWLQGITIAKKDGRKAAFFRPLKSRIRRDVWDSSTGTASQQPRACISFGARGTKGSAKTPLVVNRKIRGPAGALQAAGTSWIGKPATHLIKRSPGILPAKSWIGRVGRGHSGDNEHR
jgi:hypothetical protein